MLQISVHSLHWDIKIHLVSSRFSSTTIAFLVTNLTFSLIYDTNVFAQ
jgi:hypothetical protein